MGDSGQTKPLVVVQGLGQPSTQDLFAAVLGKVKKVVASVGHRQVLLSTGCGLDDDLQARHAIDGDPVAACQEHWGERELALPTGWLHQLGAASCSQQSSQNREESVTPCGSFEECNHLYVPISVSLILIHAHS